MADRIDLQFKLEDILGSNNVYFQPPEKIKLQYPCIVYKRTRPYNRYADNNSYLIINAYTLTYIDKNPDNDMTERLLKAFNRIEAGSSYNSDSLYHYSFELYY